LHEMGRGESNLKKRQSGANEEKGQGKKNDKRNRITASTEKFVDFDRQKREKKPDIFLNSNQIGGPRKN